MSMHLEGPWLSTTGKKKGKKKWASADAKRKADMLNDSWAEILKKYAPVKSTKKSGKAEVCPPVQPYRRGEDQPRIPSLNGGVDSAPALKAPDKVYTGTKIKGIGTMHKSNAVPIFSDDEAVAIAQMRR